MDSPRLTVSGALPGEENMALDEAALESRPARPLLRFYRWDRPTLSLGYFQKSWAVADLDYCARRGVPVVRRPTGGGAILHDREFTLSLVLPLSHPLLACPLEESYLALTRPVLEVLRSQGLEASFRGGAEPARHADNCFAGAACPDLVLGGRKVFGSAQRRKGGAALFHGSLLLAIDRDLWQGVFGDHLGQGFTGLSEVLGREPGFDELAGSLAKAFEALFGQPLDMDKSPLAC